MIKFNNTAVFILSGALMLSFASCSMVSEPASTNKIVNPSVSMGLAEDVRKPSRGISNNAAVNYAEYELSEDDDLKVMENKIETKYGIDIVFGEEVRTEFSDESEQLIAEKYTDEAKIKKALIDVDGVLKVYPKTFFYQLRLTEDDPVKIYLTGAIKSLTYPDASITAFTSDNDSKGEFFLTVDIAGQDGVFNPIDVMHEIVHLTDFKLKKMGLLKEEDWAALNPEGFTYTSKSGKGSEDKYNFAQSEYCPLKENTSPADVYFVCPYSQSNEYDDRATLLTNSLVFALYGYEVEPEVYKCQHLQAKMEYWFGQVRKGFDTSYWDKTPWEDSYSKLK